ncbi:foldase protein PrsA [Lachnotalea glycerini]|nr:peptidyl-prolyl cis-trans isomerase [Lachnotalea glycerini]PXV91104.1 foldase protein PrsA [Lachnotalea glycerini]
MKRNIGRRLVGAAAGVLACATMITGCAGSVDLNKAVAVVNQEEIPFGVAKFYAKMQQATYETYYGAMFGDNMWDQQISDGVTFEDSTLESILEELKEIYIVDQYADEYNVALTEEEKTNIDTTAKAFVEDNNAEALEEMGANEEILKEYLTKYTLKSKIENEIKAGADTEVSDEDAAQKTFSYVLVSTSGTTDESGNTVELTEEEIAAKKAEAQAIVDASLTSGDFDTAVTDAGKTASTASYGKDDDAGMDAAVITAADALSEGETSQVIETDSGYYVIHLTSAYDEEQTQSRREEIISERQDTLYSDTYTQWKDASEITVNNKIWKKINFDEKITVTSNVSTDDVTVGESTTDAAVSDDASTSDEEQDNTTADDTTTGDATQETAPEN